jgi:hypothetical protein
VEDEADGDQQTGQGQDIATGLGRTRLAERRRLHRLSREAHQRVSPSPPNAKLGDPPRTAMMIPETGAAGRVRTAEARSGLSFVTFDL